MIQIKTAGRADMAYHISTQHGVTIQDAERMVSQVLEAIRVQLVKGHKVTLLRVGTLTPDRRKAATIAIGGKTRVVKERLKIKFQASRTVDSDYRASLSSGLKKLRK